MADWFSENAPKPQAGGDWFAQHAPPPPAPTPPGFGQRVYEQTLQGPVELAKGLWNDPRRMLMQTLASMTTTQIQAARNPMQVQQGLATPIIEDVRSGNIPGAAGGVTGLGLTLLTPKILSKTPVAARATGRAAATGATATGGAVSGIVRATPEIIGGALEGAALGTLGGPGGALIGAKIGAARVARRAATRGAREALKARAAAAAEALAVERAAAARPAPVPPIPVERQLPPVATRMPPAADTSSVRSVPGEYAVREPLPPSRQLPAPGRPAIITPAPDPLAGDTSGVRAVPAVYGSSAVNEAAVGMRKAMDLAPEQFATPAGRTTVPTVRASQIDQMARHMRAAGLTAADANLLDPPSLAPLAKNAGIEGPLGKVAVAVRKRIAAMEKAEAETAKIQAALDRLKPAERQVTESYRGEGSRFTRAGEAPAVERKPPASETAPGAYQEQVFDVGMRIRNKQAVTDAEINALAPDDAAAMRRLQNEYRVRPTKLVEPPKTIRSGNSGFEQIEGQFDVTTPNDEFLYHITTKPNAARILKEGLRPGSPSAMAAGFYRDYSRGKAFLTDAGGISYWQEKIANHIEHETGRTPNLVVVRIPKSAAGELAADTLGTRDAGAPSYFAQTPIRKPATPSVTTPAEANEFLGKQYPAQEPVEKAPALTKPQERINGLAAILADGPLSAEQLRGGLKSGGEIGKQQRFVLQQASEDAGLGKPTFSEIDRIVDEVERIRGAKSAAAFDPEWFSKSKAVDESGAPVRVYHGTQSTFDQFSPEAILEGTEKGFFFTDSPSMAGKYAETYKHTTGKIPPPPFQTPPGANVRPSYLKMENPLVKDFQGKPKYEGYEPLIARAKKAGHDGLILRNIDDPVPGEFYSPHGGVPHDVYVVFSADQVRPAFGKAMTATERAAFEAAKKANSNRKAK